MDVRRAPETTIVSGPPLLTESTSATFRFSADPAAGATFECMLDGAAARFTACPAPAADGTVTLTGIPYGIHELEVRARTAGGVVDLDPGHCRVDERRHDPAEVTITIGPATSRPTMTATFEFTVDDPAASTQCSIDGGAPVFCESPHQLHGGAAGARDRRHRRAAHPRGRPGEAGPARRGLPTVWEWTIDDQIDPDTIIESTPPARIGMDLPSIFTFASNELGSTFECASIPVGDAGLRGLRGRGA